MIQYLQGDCRLVLKDLPESSVHCCVTSPPYWGLRDYGVEGQLGQEEHPDLFVQNLVDVFRGVRRVLRDDGTLWLNLGDSYAANRTYQVPSTKGGAKHAPAQGFDGSAMKVPEGLKSKDLIGIPWRVAFALQKDGWYLRSDIIWHKPNPMPESVTDRPTKSHEYIFLLTKSEKYYYDHEAIQEHSVEYSKGNERPRTKPSGIGYDEAKQNGLSNQCAVTEKRNKRSVWTVPTSPYSGAHFAVFPPELIRPCILAGCPSGGTVLDPFGGSGTTAMVAEQEGRNAVLIELNGEYVGLQKERTQQTSLLSSVN